MGPDTELQRITEPTAGFVAVTETPTRRRVTDMKGMDPDLKVKRAATAADLRYGVPEVSFEDFMTHYMPDERVDAPMIVSCLQRYFILTSEGWTAFKPSPIDGDLAPATTEDKYFKAVERVVNSIADTCDRIWGCKTTFSFVCRPSRTPAAELLQTSCKPDCYLLKRAVSDQDICWEDILVSGEFKMKEKDRNQNVEQLLWDMNQAMRNDPARRFTLGLTIEKENTRIWYADRSEVVVSTAIDFQKNSREIVRVFLALLYANHEELGVDPSCKAVEGTNNFDISVHSLDGVKVYRTIRLLNAEKAESLRGRGTRVWECVLLDADGHEIPGLRVALKDVWVDKDRDLEGDIRELILQDANPSQKSTLDDGLVSVVCHGIVMIGGKADETRQPIGDKNLFPLDFVRDERNVLRNLRQVRKTIGAAACDTGKVNRDSKDVDIYHHKSHYRVVFGQVGVPLHSIKSLKLAFQVLRDLVSLLKTMHEIGWVHRDIGVSNVLVANGKLKLADFEYATRWDKTSTHNIRTANVFCSPVEVDKGYFCFGGDPVIDNVRFRYNPLHDLESAWWAGVYMALYRRVLQEPQGDSEHWNTDAQESVMKSLMRSVKARQDVMANGLIFMEQYIDRTHPLILPLGVKIANQRLVIAHAYRNLEGNNMHQLKDHKRTFYRCAQGTHEKLDMIFADILGYLEPDILVERFDSPSTSDDPPSEAKGSKRARQSESEPSGGYVPAKKHCT